MGGGFGLTALKVRGKMVRERCGERMPKSKADRHGVRLFLKGSKQTVGTVSL